MHGSSFERRRGREAADDTDRRRATGSGKYRAGSFERGRSAGGGKRSVGAAMALAVVFFVAAYLAIAQPFDFSGSRENPELPDTDISTAGFDIIADEDQRLILHLKPSFIVNLDGLDGRFVMKVLVQLEVNNLALVDELNNNTAKYYRMIDELLTTMKTYSYSELVYRGGVTRLKEELRRRLNRNLQSGSIVRVIFKQLYFSEQLPRRLVPAR